MFKRSQAASTAILLSILALFASVATAQTETTPQKDPLATLLKAMQELAGTQPGDPYLRADELRKQGKNTEALQAVNEAIRRDPNRGEAYALRSGILGNLQHNEDGVKDGDLGMKLSKTPRTRAMAAYNKGFNLTALDRKQEALTAFKAALQFDPTYSMAHFGRGKLFYLLGMWKESKAELSSAIAANPKYGPSYAYHAEALFNLGAVSDGMVSAEKAVALAPNDPRSFRARTIGHQLNKQYPEMLADATRAVELDPTRPLAHLYRGKAFGLLGQYDEALAEYALESDRKAVEPYLNGIHKLMYGPRMNNCGDTSTEFEVSGGKRIDTFSDCTQRVQEALEGIQAEATPAPAPRKSVPNLPARRQGKK